MLRERYTDVCAWCVTAKTKVVILAKYLVATVA